MIQPLARIVEAMITLKELRDEGESIHVILPVVAAHYRVPIDALTQRAEASWGAPLETDHERNATHFEAVRWKAQKIDEARVRANRLWHERLSRGEEPLTYLDGCWQVHLWLEELSLNDRETKYSIRSAFLAEIVLLNRHREVGCIPDAPNQ